MSEEQVTQVVAPESTEVPEQTEGVSQAQELGEEYKPYSMIPWDQIPEESREQVLQGVKKFHGGMTKGQQEAARLRAQMGELSKKAELMDRLVQEPWFRAAYEANQKGLPVAKPQEASVNLQEHLDVDAAKAIEAVIERKLTEMIGPINSRLGDLNQQQANAQAKSELVELVKKAGDNGWPDPYERLDLMTQMVANGRAKTVEDAYRLSTFDEMPGIVKEKTRQTLQEELRTKASKSIAPSMGGPKNGTTTVYSGRDAVLNAFRDTKRELGL